jgi:hypothetical protein
MNKLPKIFINKINKKISHNDEVYYSYKDKDDITYEHININDIRNKIDILFKSNDFIYKKKFHIKTKYSEKDYIIVSKSIDYLLTIDGERINIEDILEIN